MISSTSYYCSCPSNFGGTNCATAAPCGSSPCQNNGICVANTDGTYSCICIRTFLSSSLFFILTLNHGLILINFSAFFLFSCLHPASYTGLNCQNSNACGSSPCQNNGVCTGIAYTGGYSCTCGNNYSGTNCQYGRLSRFLSSIFMFVI